MSITLEVTKDGGWHRYLAHFENGDQAIEFMDRKRREDEAEGHAYGNHDFHEMEDQPLTPQIGPVNEDVLRLLDRLYPTCHHGMSLDLCGDPYGPNHFGTAEWERSMDFPYADRYDGYGDPDYYAGEDQ